MNTRIAAISRESLTPGETAQHRCPEVEDGLEQHVREHAAPVEGPPPVHDGPPARPRPLSRRPSSRGVRRNLMCDAAAHRAVPSSMKSCFRSTPLTTAQAAYVASGYPGVHHASQFFSSSASSSYQTQLSPGFSLHYRASIFKKN